jgi:hypothetical protein
MHITQEAFTTRFVPLVMGGGSLLKKSAEDQHILFVSAMLGLEPERDYSEAELNEALKPWSATFGGEFGLDHVTLRRHLIDEGYLLRDVAGTTYTLNVDSLPITYDREIAELDHEHMLEEALREREERRRKYTQSN